ncbi:hypothetical protein BJV77DRAFT_1049552 [Russula vinacea]|nr:hypothetical protein BJV77DRAFT_1049552 [Russula vinacea]
MPAQVVARTVDPNTGLRSYSASAYFDANARARDNLHVVTNAEGESRGISDRREIYAVAVTNEVVLAAGKTAFDPSKFYVITRDSQILSYQAIREQDASGEPFWICLRLERTCKIIPVTLSDFRLKPGVTTSV